MNQGVQQGHTVASYDEELSEIANAVQHMSKVVIERLDLVANSFSAGEKALLQQVAEKENEVQEAAKALEEEVFVILAKRQPVAMDLRFTVSAIKIAAILGRVADLTGKTAKLFETIDSVPQKVRAESIDMIFLAQKMLKNACKCFRKNELEKIDSIFTREEKVDKLRDDIQATMLQELETQGGKQGKDVVFAIMAVKNVERIADYATHIASLVHFVLEGAYPEHV